MRRGAIVALGVVLVAACSTSHARRSAPAARQSTPPPLRRVLIVGDSVLFDAEPAIEAAIRATGVTNVRAEPYFGMGLTRTDLYDWHVRWPPLVASIHPDLVVNMLGQWDIDPKPSGANRDLVPGVPGWRPWYEGLVEDAVGVLTASGARVLWLGMPWDRDPATVPKVEALNEVYRAVAARHPAMTFVDAAAALAGPDGRYAETVDGAGPDTTRLRKPDGIHLCPAGAERLGAAVIARVEAMWKVRADPRWRSADWRADGRYFRQTDLGCQVPLAAGVS